MLCDEPAVRAADDGERAWIEQHLERTWGLPLVSRDELELELTLP